jgi:1-acyl-sn-glycerol-3-phosphate acyltransferase
MTNLWYALRQWLPFLVRTAAFGTVSCLLGPLTRDHRASLWAMRRWCVASIAALGIDVDARGLEHVPGDGAFVYCANHQSLTDILVLGAVLPGDYKWAAKRSLLRIPFIGWHLKLAGHVPVDRGVGAGDIVIERFVTTLGQGKPLLVFPEGTRTEDGHLQAFKTGGFRAAVRAGVPVIPVALDGTWEMMRKGAGHLRPGQHYRVRIRIGAPIDPGDSRSPGSTQEDTAASDLRDRAHAAVASLLAADARQSAA